MKGHEPSHNSSYLGKAGRIKKQNFITGNNIEINKYGFPYLCRQN